MSEDKNMGEPLPKLGRRKLIKGAVGATPLLVTLASRPAWGGNFCWSGIQSGNVSGQTRDTCSFGLSPGYYKSNVLPHGGDPGWPGYDNVQMMNIDCGCNQFKSNGTIKNSCKDMFQDPNANNVPGTTLGQLFYSAPGNIKDMTLMQVLWQEEGSFAFHAIATYFNCINFIGYAFSPQDALGIINDIFATGTHTDSNGKIWTESEMKALFDSAYHMS